MFPPDLSAERLERYLESLRTGRKNLSVQTANDYLQAASQFAKWMTENGRLERNPFLGVKKLNAERDRRHVRLPFDLSELRSLIAAARTAPPFRKLPGGSRAVLYAVAAATGYRCQELAVLVPGNFVLVADSPAVELDGRFTKNGRNAYQSIPPDLADELRGFLAGRPAGAPSGRGRGPTGPRT